MDMLEYYSRVGAENRIRIYYKDQNIIAELLR